MTVSTTTSRVAYTGDGVTVAFAVPFPFFDPADLVVTERTIATGTETVKMAGTHYTAAGGGGATGTVTALAAPSSTVQWIIVRAMPFTQLIDYVSNDGFPAETHEAGLDRAVMRDQELQTALAQTLRFPVTDSAALETVLPNSILRAGKVLGFDANGNPVALLSIPEGEISLPLALADGGTGAGDATGARAALAVAGLADTNLFTANQTIRSNDAGALAGPVLMLDRDSPSPAANDVLGAIAFAGENGAGSDAIYSQIQTEIVDTTPAAEGGLIAWLTRAGGALAARMRLGAGLILGEPTGGDPGNGWINVAGGFKLNNIEIVGVQAGAVVNRAYAQTTSFSNISAVIPFDDTVPQSGEGTQVLSVSLAPRASANKLLVTVTLQVGSNAGLDAVVAAVFRDSEANARAAAVYLPTENRAGSASLTVAFEMTAGSTGTVEFKVRMGPGSTGNAFLNGNDGARVLGGALVSAISVEEMKV